MHCLTNTGNWELRIDFAFDNGTKSFMHYNHFSVGPATDNYRLNISGFTGITPTDRFTTFNINTVYVQIFEGCNFRGLPKSRISAILFSWISCYHTLYFKCITTVL